MATTGNFGKIKDISVNELYIRNKKIIDSKRNVKNNNLYGKNMVVRKDATICGDLVTTGPLPGNFTEAETQGDLRITGNVNLCTLGYSNLEIPNDFANYTDIFGPTIQGVRKYVDYDYTATLGGNEFRNGDTYFYLDILPLTTSINKKIGYNSFVKITVSIFGEVHYNSTIVVQKYNKDGVYIGDVETTQYPDPGRNFGIMSWPYDVDVGTTPNMVSFTVLDTQANTAENWTYKIRIYSLTAYVFYLNKVANTSLVSNREYGTSTILLEEVTRLSPPKPNTPPFVDAGEDISVSLSGSGTLAGRVIDDGLPIPPGLVSSIWSQISGPGTTVFSDNTSLTSMVTFDLEGVYVLQLEAYDGEFTVSDTVNITVSSYVSGLPGIRYVGYFSDNVNWFVTATKQGQTNILTNINNFSSNADNYSWEWIGFFRPSATGTWTFQTSSDDASYLWVGSKAASGFTTSNATVNNGGLHGNQTRQGSEVLTGGVYYPMRVQFGELGGGDIMTVRFTGPGVGLTTNGSGYYFHIPI